MKIIGVLGSYEESVNGSARECLVVMRRVQMGVLGAKQ